MVTLFEVADSVESPPQSELLLQSSSGLQLKRMLPSVIIAANHSDERSSSVELRASEKKNTGRAEPVRGIFNQKAAAELSSS